MPFHTVKFTEVIKKIKGTHLAVKICRARRERYRARSPKWSLSEGDAGTYGRSNQSKRTVNLVKIYTGEACIYGQLIWSEFKKGKAWIHGPSIWSKFIKGKVWIHGPTIWSEFFKGDEGIHGPSIWSKFINGKAWIHGPPNQSEFEKRGFKDPRTGKSVKMFRWPWSNRN